MIHYVNLYVYLIENDSHHAVILYNFKNYNNDVMTILISLNSDCTILCYNILIARSPAYSHMSATVQGLTVIRAFGMQHSFVQLFYKYQDHQSRALHLFLCSSRWFVVRVDCIVAIYLSCSIMAVFVIPSTGKLHIVLLLKTTFDNCL